MAKGFFKGAAWGVCVGLSALVLFSAAEYAPDHGQTEVSVQGGVSGQPSQPSPEEIPSAVELSPREVPAPEPDTLEELVSDTLSPAAIPQAGSASGLSDTQVPESDAISGVAQTASKAPQVVYAETGSLQTPASESDLSISTEPAQPVAPDAVPQETAFGSTAETEEKSDVAESDGVGEVNVTTEMSSMSPPVASSEDVGLVTGPVLPEAPGAESEAVGFDSAALAEVAGNAGALPDQVTGNATQDQDVETEVAALQQEKEKDKSPPVDANAPEQPEQQLVVAETPSVLSPEIDAPATAGAVALQSPSSEKKRATKGESLSAQVDAEISVQIPGPNDDQVAAGAPTISQAIDSVTGKTPVAKPSVNAVVDAGVPHHVTGTAPAPQSTAPDAAPNSSEAVRVNQLPSLGAEAPSDDEPFEEFAALPLENVATVQSPLERFAVDFENPDNKPLMAVILMDDGRDFEVDEIDFRALQQLPYPVSLAVDALLADAADRMRAYRAAGFEVLATVDLPEGAQASDAEVNLSVALGALPEVVAVLDGARTGVQTTPEAGRQVAEILAQSGHGFVTQNNGLNTVQKLATRQGVPSAIVFRDFDAKDQSSTVIRRFLDQAAFRAGQEGAVIMLGRVRQETLTALELWALQDRASSVAVAPVSAVLRAP